jgi:type I restriction enzyme S subunit
MNTSTIRFKALEGVSDLGFLRHWLQSLEFRSQITREVTGIAQKNFGPSHLKRLKISLPPLSEQKRIAAILDEADALRTKRRESLDELDTLLQSTFLDMFGDPVTNPKGWEVRALAEFYVNKHEGTKCGPFGSALRKGELVRSGVPVWNMDNIDPTGRAKLPFRMWITEDKYEDLRAFSVLPGDVIISRAGTVGKMCVAGPDCPKSVINTNLIRVRFGRQLLPLYFVSLMTYCKGRVGRLKTGPEGAFTHMSTGVLDKLSIPYPPLSVQRRFAAFVQAVEAQKSRYRAQLAELDDLFGSLQQKAFAGELTGNAEVRAGNAEVRAGNAEVRAGNAEVRAGNAERRAGKCQRGSASAERGVWSEERKKVMQSEENMRAVNEKSQEGACGVTDCDTTEDEHGTKPMNE